jgi:hypothetical protein
MDPRVTLKLTPSNQWRLIDILGAISGANRGWRLIRFKGVGDGDILNFERRLESLKAGLPMSWKELTDFAARVRDTWWLTVAADAPPEPLKIRGRAKLDLTEAAIVLECFDSTDWTISFLQSVARQIDLDRIARRM